ncbi:hypothetical protein [Novosphingobium sp.]
MNERLVVCGLIVEFDRARSRWDVEALRSIFAEIDLSGYDLEQLR